MNPFPWDAAIGFGLGVLRIPPREFWAMTPRELALAIRAVKEPAVAAPDRIALESLMTRFPDAQPAGNIIKCEMER
jgi:uncharacterized phage protein (TIGR02216 family)